MYNLSDRSASCSARSTYAIIVRPFWQECTMTNSAKIDTSILWRGSPLAFTIYSSTSTSSPLSSEHRSPRPTAGHLAHAI